MKPGFCLLLVLVTSCDCTMGVGFEVSSRATEDAAPEHAARASGSSSPSAARPPDGTCTLPECSGANIQDPGSHNRTPSAR